MSKKTILKGFLLFVFIQMLPSCAGPGEEQLILFHSDFSTTTIAGDYSTLNGDFEAFKNTDPIEYFTFQMNCTPPENNYIEITSDPEDSENNVLHAEIIDGCGEDLAPGRIQGSITFDYDLDEYWYKMDLYLHPDWIHLEDYSGSIYWLAIFEYWEEHADTTGNTAGQAHWQFDICKNSGAGQSLFWRFYSEKMQPEEAYGDEINPVLTNTEVNVPIGQWFTLEVKITRGQADGNIYIAITPEGKSKQVIWDYAGYTEYPSIPLPVAYFQPWKYYMQEELPDYMRTNGYNFSIYYDNFTFYDTR